MSSSAHLLHYAALRSIEGLVRLLPRTVALPLGTWTGEVLFRLGIRRNVVAGNMQHVDLWTSTEISVITRKLYRMTGRYWIDFLRPSKNLPPYTVENPHLIEQLFSRGKGVVVLLGHFGSWEVLARIFGSKIPDLTVIGRPMQNPYVDRWLDRKRTETGVAVITPERALRKSIQILRRNGMIGLLIDQHAGKLGTVVPFLGKPASTIRTAAGLQVRTGCSILPSYALLEKKGSYRVVLEPLNESEQQGTGEDLITWWMIRHNEILSGWIRQYPEHWFGWFHRRFRASLKY